jgi:hypothetical protein
VSSSTIPEKLRRLFDRPKQPVPQQPPCPWFGAVDAKRLAAECTSADRFVIRDPTGIAKRFRRHTDEGCIGWTLLHQQNCSLINFAMDYFGWGAPGAASDWSMIGAHIFELIGREMDNYSNGDFAAALKSLSPIELSDYAGPVFEERNFAELSGLASEDDVADAIDTGGRHICLVLAQLATYLDVLEDGEFSIDRWFHGGGKPGSALFLTAGEGTARQYEWLVQNWYESSINAYDLPAYSAHGKVWFLEGREIFDCRAM